jgi:Icc-related predicted phosphoesterase
MNYEIERKIDRLIEESLWQSIKNNPGKSAAVGGGLGLLGYGLGNKSIQNTYNSMKDKTIGQNVDAVVGAVKEKTNTILNTPIKDMFSSAADKTADVAAKAVEAGEGA